MKKILKILFVLSLIATIGVLTACDDEAVSTPGGQIQDYGSIEVVGKDGTTQIVELGTLETVTGYGGVRRSTGTINGPGQITGITFEELLAEVGGFTSEDTIQVIASDGYEATLAGDAVLGNVITYDVNGELIDAVVQGVIMVESDNEDLTAGLPRVAFIAEEPVLTDGFQWARDVATVKVIGATTTEETAPVGSADASWTIEIVGAEQATFTNIDAEAIGISVASATHIDRDGVETVQEWTGITMKELVEYLGVANATEVTVEAIDGFSRTFDQELINNEGVRIAWEVDGVALSENDGPVQTVADSLARNLWIKQVAKITVVAPAVAEGTADVAWTIEVVGAEQAKLTNEDAEKIGVKNVMATHRDRDGNETVQEWTGVLVKDLLEYLGAPNATEVIIEAIDGFNRTYDHELISSDGTLIAWLADGVALDENSGPVQTVADGKGPNWWIKQVAKVTIK
ncbi:molybdopterin-dependent oxidoreductase [Desulfuribacillus alkaliarsenatis]|uniref:Oxidoreductase molybdopterin-binding domain-containing protein n=1 Tax=Desulfuribacillus alkaliarsenatis TaxID=766136 RepID=A0A1E5FZA7_9FIRM|nr:molybdopterin-dependent oxidoreductase [Desulfuribacillus alkaliarsenatis]OEF95910.1 hypothetical protein BHF68_11000 [Desulfuribacillus alkaliarsenatis]